MMLTQRIQVRKCLLKSKTEVYVLYKKESDLIREPDPEIATSREAAP
jgi:hypothetical protein